jgi:pimeloyl-ACP methyl ester carboxylesterase
MVTSAVVNGVEIAFELFGEPEGDPVVLICGCGQPSAGWHAGIAPALQAAGHRVVIFDNRGVFPSASPPGPYSIDDMVLDTLGLLDHLGIERAHIAGYSMGGWIAETLAARHPERVASAAFIGSCNIATSWEKAITTVERDLARLDPELPSLFYATETLRYLPNSDLQNDQTVNDWLSLIGDEAPWPNPGRLGQYEACLAWSTRPDGGEWWSSIGVRCLVVAFEHDVDSPPLAARAAAARIPDARVVEFAGASHLGPFTHGAEVGAALATFFAEQ